MSEIPMPEGAAAATQAVEPDAGPCPVCGGEVFRQHYVCRVRPHQGKAMTGCHCQTCGLVRFPENVAVFFRDIRKDSMGGSLRALRNANDERPGREFYMAEMGIEVLDRPTAEVSFFGSGMNTDWRWLEKRFPQAKTKLTDMENFQEAANFEPIADATPSDVVIACEVIEHFTEPVAHFASLLRLVKDDGILICSSNIYDGTDINLHQYPFENGHVAYWTPLSLVKVASDAGFFVDFRTPEMSLTRGGPRKKYIIFYRQVETLYRMSLYFGTHMFAPSEKT
ncbi:methyltransferase domain-containing protein [Hydrogenophaga electricum]|nr:methyltransferase domain-containing protein [Hydrogenophaga electricum]